jgi:hypothetical protein
VCAQGITKLPQRNFAFWPNLVLGGRTVSARAVHNASYFSSELIQQRQLEGSDPRGITLMPDDPKRVNPTDALEEGINDICRSYAGVGCLSQREALIRAFAEERVGFDIRDIAGDCLHPAHGRLGTEYMTDILVHWSMRVANRR